MRIALVSDHASPLSAVGGVDAGGQNVHVAELARGLARQGAEVVVHTRRDAASLPDQVELAPGVIVDHIDAGPPRPIPKDNLFPYMATFADQLHRRWSGERPDIVHAHFWMSGWASLTAGNRLGLPVVQTFHALGAVKRRHQGVKDTSPKERQAVERAILRRADQVIATCTDEVFELCRLGADRSRISVVPCGVDTDLFSPTGPQAPRARFQPRPRIVVVSRLVERKGIGNVIEALSVLPGTELVVAGGPPPNHRDGDADVRRLRRVAAEWGVAHRVDLQGQVERAKVPALLRSADVVACAPWYEPFGIVALEAQACGVPVVATAVGGHIDTVLDGVTGLLVPPRAPKQLSDALAWLLARPEDRAAMGEAGTARVRERYRWETVAAATHRVYQSLVRRDSVSVSVPR
ncbi:MAG TPA: glycosyltransferase [Acidimicrobiales bacterium]|jgi:glycosyltransferase involved in cell wall biosynthesis|nr:glycosyltransferase [Acidimicrobiales bacterium]